MIHSLTITLASVWEAGDFSILVIFGLIAWTGERVSKILARRRGKTPE